VTGDHLDDTVCRQVRKLRATGTTRVLVCVGSIDEGGLFAAVEAGACGVIRRSEATPDALGRALRAAAGGDGALPPDLLGKLLSHVQGLTNGLLAPRGLRLSGLTQRETDVLRLVADGHDTREIADKLCYSERTVKNVIHDLTTRLQLRNRAHAVAYAVRQGLI
jgi:DNA-binding NarL/FixJ family response regulator